MASNRDPFDVLTEEWEPQIRAAFLDAVQGIVEQADVQLIARLVEAGDIDGALRAVGVDPLDFRGLDYRLNDLFRDAGNMFAQGVPAIRNAAGSVVRFAFDARNPRAERWIRDRSGNLITEIVADQQVMIRNNLLAGLEAGKNPRTTALDLVGRVDPRTKQRTGGVIGLTSAQEEWQRRYAAELRSGDPSELRKALGRGLRDKRFDRSIEKAIRTGEPIPAATIQRMVIAYRNRSLKYRADTISRNETIQSIGQAQVEAWQQAIDGGQVARQDIRKIPVSIRDERVRFNHRLVEKMNKDGVPWDQPYKVPPGMAPQMHAPYNEVGCRCRERIKVDRTRGLR